MVKAGTAIGVAVIAVVGFLLYQFLSKGGVSVDPNQSSNTDVHPSPSGYANASGAGSLAVTQIYSPATSYTSSYQTTNTTTTTIIPKIGILNF